MGDCQGCFPEPSGVTPIRQVFGDQEQINLSVKNLLRDGINDLEDIRGPESASDAFGGFGYWS